MKLKNLKREIKKELLLIINYLLNYPLIFKLIGIINKKFKIIENIFIAYPANRAYAEAYAYKRFYPQMKWTPWIAALLKHKKSFGIMMVVSATEEDFLDSANLKNLQLMVKRTEIIGNLLGVSQITYSGVLPGILHKHCIRQSYIEADITINVILASEKLILSQLGFPSDLPLIILGNKGFIGTRLTSRLNNREYYSIDFQSPNAANVKDWPFHLKNKPAVLINVSRKFVMTNYIHLFWPELIIINDVYPESSREEIQKISEIGCSFYHVSGVKGRSWPRFPKVYKEGLPCCGTTYSKDPSVIVHKYC